MKSHSKNHLNLILSLKDLKSKINGIEGSYFDGVNLLGISKSYQDLNFENDNFLQRKVSNPSKNTNRFNIKENNEASFESLDFQKINYIPQPKSHKDTLSQIIFENQKKVKKERKLTDMMGSHSSLMDIKFFSQLNTNNFKDCKNILKKQQNEIEENLMEYKNSLRDNFDYGMSVNDSVDNVSRFKPIGLFDTNIRSSSVDQNLKKIKKKKSKFKSNGVFLEINGLHLEQVYYFFSTKKRMQRLI